MEEYLRRVLKLPERVEVEEGDVQRPAQAKKKPDDDLEDDDEKQFGEGKYHRNLTKAERRVKFDEIRDYMDAAQQEVINKMMSVLTREKARLLPRFEDAIRRGDYADLQRISWALKGPYAGTFVEQIKKLFEYGKLKASYEIKKPAPATTVEIVKRITEKAFFLADRHEKQLLEELKGIAAVGMMDSEISDVVALDKVKEGFDKFTKKNVPATASLVTTEEINNGRIYTFETFKDDLYGYQWSAILDGATCNYCQSMDGRVIGTEDKAFSSYKPGAVHFNCRCIWVGIMKEEKSPPPYTGIPAGLRPQTSVPAWEFKDLEYPLPGSGKRKMPYGVGVYNEGGDNK